MSSFLNAERNDMGTGLDSGGANNLGTTREIRPTIGSVASGLPIAYHPSVFGFPTRFQTVSGLRMIETCAGWFT